MAILRKKRTLRRLLLGAVGTAVLAALACGQGFAADPVSLQFQDQNNVYDIQGFFFVDADPSVAWDVLTGYDRLSRFVDSLKRSLIVEDLGPYHYLLAQEFQGGFLFFTKSVQVLLDVHETWYKNIDFIDIAHRDFKFYRGSWEIQENPKGLEITYNLTAQQNFEAPFAGDYMKGGVRDLLDAVRKEILRCQTVKIKETLEKRSSP